jgi:tryptophan halogenase
VISFLSSLGLDEHDLVKQTHAGLKLGILFQDWREKGERYFHPFGRVGCELDGLEFFQYWLKARDAGDLTPLMDYAPAAVMAGHGKFAFPFKFPSGSPLAGAEHALHLDTNLVVGYLREFCEKHRVKRISGHVVRVHRRDNGNIESLELNSRQMIQGDFFIDCSGFRGLLIGETLNVPYESWKHFLPCDRAVTAQSGRRGATFPYMISTARESGWSWQIPLQERISNGYVFSSEHCSDDQARQILLDSMAGKPLVEPHFIPFRTGIRKQMWKKNCIALGFAAGFLEPLESTAIHLITRSAQFLLELFPNLSQDEQDWPGLASEYNARMRADYEEVRDFIIVHYCTTKRTDTEFWRRCQSAPMPEHLEEKIGLFKAHGQLRIACDRLFGKSSWQAVFTGMGLIPRGHHPFADMGGFDRIHLQMKSDRNRLEEAVKALPVYRGFLLD